MAFLSLVWHSNGFSLFICTFHWLCMFKPRFLCFGLQSLCCFGSLASYTHFHNVQQWFSLFLTFRHISRKFCYYEMRSVFWSAQFYLYFFKTNRCPVYEIKLLSFENEVGNKSHWNFSEFPVRVPTTLTEQLPGFKKWLCWSIYKAGKALGSNLLIKSPRFRKAYDQESHMYINCCVAWNSSNPCWQGCTFKYVYL